MDTSYPPPNARSFIRGPSAGRVWLNHGQFGDRDIEKDAYDGEPATHRMAYNYRMRLKDSKGNIIQVIIHEQILVDLRDEPDARRKAGQRLRKPANPGGHGESAPVGKRRPRSRGARRNPKPANPGGHGESAPVGGPGAPEITASGKGPGKRPTRRGNRGGRKSGRTP